jgi:ribonuclease HI
MPCFLYQNNNVPSPLHPSPFTPPPSALSQKRIALYTDGACSGNPGPGGWGVVLIHKDHKKELSGSIELTTNNQMELLAVIKGLESLKEPCDVTLYTDSKYVVLGMTEWVKDWIKRGWRTSSKKPVKNVELWQRLVELSKQHTMSYQWVKGHADNEYNNRCDELATDAIKRSKMGSDMC